VIPQVKGVHGNLTFIAELYEDSELSLQQDGFDYAYDKDKLYDRLKHGDAASVHAHLSGSSLSYLEHRTRPRGASPSGLEPAAGLWSARATLLRDAQDPRAVRSRVLRSSACTSSPSRMGRARCARGCGGPVLGAGAGVERAEATRRT